MERGRTEAERRKNDVLFICNILRKEGSISDREYSLAVKLLLEGEGAAWKKQ